MKNSKFYGKLGKELSIASVWLGRVDRLANSYLSSSTYSDVGTSPVKNNQYTDSGIG